MPATLLNHKHVSLQTIATSGDEFGTWDLSGVTETVLYYYFYGACRMYNSGVARITLVCNGDTTVTNYYHNWAHGQTAGEGKNYANDNNAHVIVGDTYVAGFWTHIEGYIRGTNDPNSYTRLHGRFRGQGYHATDQTYPHYGSIGVTWIDFSTVTSLQFGASTGNGFVQNSWLSLYYVGVPV